MLIFWSILEVMKNIIKNLRCFNLILLGFFLLIPLGAENEGKGSVPTEKKEMKITKMIPLRTIEYSTIDSICRPMLSPKGTMVFIKEKNSVFLFDFQKNVENIVAIISKIDSEVVNIRINVDFIEQLNSKNDNVNVKVKYKGFPNATNQVIIKDGKVVKPSSIKFGAFRRRGTGHRNTSQFILTRSGSPARIWSGKSMVDPSWLANYQLQPTIVMVGNSGTVVLPGSDNDIVWTDIGASLFVLPKYLGNGKIDLEVYPVVSYLVDDNSGRGLNSRFRGKRQAVKVSDISTHITLRSGQRISLGGVISSNKDFFTNLFGPELMSRKSANSILDMYITATVLDPAGRRIPGLRNKSDLKGKKKKSNDVYLDDIIHSKEDPTRLRRYRY